MGNHYVKELLIKYYGYKCWLMGEISKSNPLTLHHIKPQREGGPTTIENGALLSLEKHALFNILESKYPELANEINAYFIVYKGNYPEDIYNRINEIMSLIDYEPKKIKHKKSNYQKCLRKHRR